MKARLGLSGPQGSPLPPTRREALRFKRAPSARRSAVPFGIDSSDGRTKLSKIGKGVSTRLSRPSTRAYHRFLCLSNAGYDCLSKSRCDSHWWEIIPNQGNGLRREGIERRVEGRETDQFLPILLSSHLLPIPFHSFASLRFASLRPPTVSLSSVDHRFYIRVSGRLMYRSPSRPLFIRATVIFLKESLPSGRSVPALGAPRPRERSSNLPLPGFYRLGIYSQESGVWN